MPVSGCFRRGSTNLRETRMAKNSPECKRIDYEAVTDDKKGLRSVYDTSTKLKFVNPPTNVFAKQKLSWRLHELTRTVRMFRNQLRII